MLSRPTTKSAAFSTALIASLAISGTALAQKKYDTGATDTEIKVGNIMKQAASLKDFRTEVLLPGIKINTSPTDFAPISSLQLMKFKGDKWELFGEVINADAGG